MSHHLCWRGFAPELEAPKDEADLNVAFFITTLQVNCTLMSKVSMTELVEMISMKK